MTGQSGNPQQSTNVPATWASTVLDRFRRPREPLSMTTPAASIPARALPKVEVRRVRRVLRKIDPWTVLKAALIFNLIAGLVFVLGMWVVWSIALQRGIPDGIASIFEALTLTFTPNGELYFRALLLFTVVGVVVATAGMTLGAVVYNLISDLVGGIEFHRARGSLPAAEPDDAPARCGGAPLGPPDGGDADRCSWRAPGADRRRLPGRHVIPQLFR